MFSRTQIIVYYHHLLVSISSVLHSLPVDYNADITGGGVNCWSTVMLFYEVKANKCVYLACDVNKTTRV